MNNDPNRPAGVTVNTGEEEAGYVLFPVIQSKKTLLLSNDGRIVKVWDGDYYSAYSSYLKDNGDLVRAVALPETSFGPVGPWSYMSGRVEELSWDGDLLWSYESSSEHQMGHHDIRVMPNGHILLLVYDRHFEDEALAAGLNPEKLPEDHELWGENIVEIDPATNEVVWEWSTWDHLIQDFDPMLDNYGVAAAHPEKVDINYGEVALTSDWLHMNAVVYNADLDQIMLSSKNFSEIWIIDHSISTEEAKGTGGDLLYRWGNPEVYQAGTDADQTLYGQHDPNWIPDGYPGAGDILIYDNGSTDERPYSRIVQITPPVDENGDYVMKSGESTGPEAVTWEYIADPPESFFSAIISGAQRQPNGDTLIAEGTNGRIFEVNPEGKTVWEYYLPPAAMIFRAERYNLPVFADLDQGQDLSAELGFGIIWGKDCQDGTKPRLHAYLQNEADDMTLFNNTYGDKAQVEWETESCAEHGGVVAES
ncbi:MAG TPA: aryl-sulfate sulfotransferase [Phototrophicaceae bacterium]|nr:aryl-sulfate sulfotransferase [Phototrophicaceae bacterium]